MSYLVLLWALSNGVSTQEMVLAIYRSFSFVYPLFGSLKMSGVLVTYSKYRHPPSPDKFPLQSQNPNSPQCAHSSRKGLAIQKLQEIQSHTSKGVWTYLLKKIMKTRKKKFHTPFRKSCKIWSSNKKIKLHPSVSPFSPSPLDILSSIRSQLAKYQPSMDHSSAWQYR